MVCLVDRDAVLIRTLVDVQNPPLELGSVPLGADLSTVDTTATRLWLLGGDLFGEGSSLIIVDDAVDHVAPIEIVLATLQNACCLELFPKPLVAARLPDSVMDETKHCDEVNQVDGQLLVDASFHASVLVALLLAVFEPGVAGSYGVNAWRSVRLGDGGRHLRF